MITRDDAIRIAATVSNVPYDQVRDSLDRFLDSLLKFNTQTLKGIGIVESERKARRRRQIVNTLNRTQQ